MEEKYIKLSDAKKAIMDYIAEQTVSKYGSLEACMDAKFSAKGAMNELDYIPAADVVPKSEVDDLEYKLIGVMHSVDKWLECDELEQDEVNRAITMREKTLRIVESAKSKVERWRRNLEAVLEERAEEKAEVAREIFERLHAHRKFDGHTVSVWLDDLVCIAKEYGIDLEQYDAPKKKTEV